MVNNIKREFVFKVVLTGEGSVGKTSIRSKFMGVGFKSEYIKTIGADFASKAIVIGDNRVHFQIWDLAGQKMYRHVRSSFYSGCKCGFLVFDLTQPETLEKLEEWVEEAIEHSGGFIKVFIIIGNKSDLKDQIKVNPSDVNKLLKKLKDIPDIDAAYIETSAKTGENINEAFETMGKLFLEKEGFPRKGHSTEIDDKTLEKHSIEIQSLISAPSAQIIDSEINQVKNLTAIESGEVQTIVQTILDKINQLTQITIALEERLLLIETKKGSNTSATADIDEIKSKINVLEQQLERFSITVDQTPEDEQMKLQFPTIDSRPTIPVPSIKDITETSKQTPESHFEVLDRTSLDTMEVLLDDDEDEESITEILTETEKISRDDIKLDKPVEKTITETQKRCPKCGTRISFIKQYNRYYCYRCKLYV